MQAQAAPKARTRTYAEIVGVTCNVARDAEAAADAAAALVTERASAAIRATGRFSIALSGGSTPQKMFDRLASAYQDRIDWQKVHVFWGDERTVGPDHPDSNYGMAYRHLLSKVPVPQSQIYRMIGENEPKAAAQAYERELRRVLAPGPLGMPHIDIVLQGIGEDGHTASLFPGTAALDVATTAVAANHVDKLATNRLTLTYPALNAAGLQLVLVCGAAKAPVVAQVLDGRPEPRRFPVQGLNPASGASLWILDEAAAASRPRGPEAPHA